MPEETELRPTPETDAVIAADSGGGDFIKALVDKGKQLERERDRLLEAVSLALRTNGGPIDGADTLNGEAYVMVRACAFADLEAAIAEVKGAK